MLTFYLAWREKKRSPSVYLVDTNGPFLGGVDKACRIVDQIHDQDSIVVEDCDESFEIIAIRKIKLQNDLQNKVQFGTVELG